MTLKKDDIKKLSELTRIEVKTLTDAINSEEETPLEFNDDLQVFDSEELEARDVETAKKGGKAAVEIAVKEGRKRLVKEFGDEYNFTGKIVDNLYDKLLEAATDKANKEANKKPNETIEQQKGTIETLQGNLKQMEEEKDEQIKALKAEKQKMQNNVSVSSKIPDGLDTSLTNKDLTNLFNIEHEVKIDEDGNRTWYRDGKPLLDPKTQKPQELDVIIPDWIDNKGLKPKQDVKGRGGADEKGKKTKSDVSSIKTSDDFYAYCKEKEIPHSKRKEILAKVKEENPEFVLGES